MSRKHFLIALSILLTALWGCQKEDSVSISPRSTSLSAEAGSVFVGIVAQGAWTLSLEYPSGTTGWASVNPASGTGSRNDVILSFSANASETIREVTLVVNPAAGASTRVTLVQAAKAAEAVGGNYGYDVAPMDWLELPAMVAGDGRELLVHDMSGGRYANQGKSGTRNWSCYWDYDDHLSLWVAYPLNNSLKGSGSRKDGWGALDPCLPESMQPRLGNGSYGGGWTRGHQLPAADRASSNAAAHRSTYYSTNQTPQDYNFNTGVWASLENRVRNYAALSDTLYVVTGCQFDNSQRVSGNNSGFYVKVPTHYFKALLYKGKNKAAVTDGYMAVAFYLPHDSGIPEDANSNDYICSITELEAKTGIDFFPNLAKRIGTEKAKQIEGETPNNFWKTH